MSHAQYKICSDCSNVHSVHSHVVLAVLLPATSCCQRSTAESAARFQSKHISHPFNCEMHYACRLTSTLTVAYHGVGSGRGRADRGRRRIQVHPDRTHTEGEEGQGAKGEAEQDNCQGI